MHDAFYPIRLIHNNLYEFESLSCFQNYLLIGTTAGKLLIYKITPTVIHHPLAFIPPEIAPEIPPNLLEFNPIDNTNAPSPVRTPLPTFNVHVCATHNLAKKRIIKLHAVPEYGMFLALTEYQLAAYQLSDRQLVAVVPNSTGASLFSVMYQSCKAVDRRKSSISTPLGRLRNLPVYTEESPVSSDGLPLKLNICVCVKRKLYFFQWSATKLLFLTPDKADDARIASWPSEFALPDAAKSMVFCGDGTLFVALRTDYLMLNLSTKTTQCIDTPSKLGTTLLSPLPYCLDTALPLDSCSAVKATAATSAVPTESKWRLGLAAPFAFASDEHLFTMKPPPTATSIGRVENNNWAAESVALKWSGIAQCLQVFPPYLLAGLPKRLEVRSLDPSEMVQTFPIPCVRAMCSNELGWLYASAPASTFKSDDSQPDLTSTAGVTTPTLAGHGSDVWLLLPANRLQLVQCLAQKNEFEMALKVARFNQLCGQPAVATSQLAARFAFHLFDVRREFEAALQLFYRLNTDPALAIGLCPDLLPEDVQRALQYPSTPKNLSATQNQSLYEPLIAFLVRWRNHLRGKCPRDTSLKDFLDQAVHVSTIVTNGTVAVRRHHLLQIVDTSLLKCYLVTNSMRIGPLLRQENYCHLDEVEKILTEQKCLEDLVTMYKARGLHHKALKCLAAMAMCEDTRPKNETPFAAAAASSSTTTPARSNSNHQQIVSYLKHLSGTPFDLVAEYAEWILRQQPRAWMSVFTAWEMELRLHLEQKSTEPPVSFDYRDKVVRYLERVAPHLIIPFIERLIFTPFNVADEEEEEGFEALNGTTMFDNEPIEDPYLGISRSPLSVGSLVSSTTANWGANNDPRTSLVNLPLIASTPARPTAASSISVSGIASGGCPQQHWQFTCLWPFPRRHRTDTKSVAGGRVSVADEDMEATAVSTEDDDEMPEICQGPAGSPEPTELHNRYARTLIRQIQSLLGGRAMTYRVSDANSLGAPKDADFENSGADGGSSRVLVARLRLRLLRFLRKEGARFSAEDILPHLSYDGFFEERAVLLARLKRHKQALTMWVHLLDDWDAALQHCASVQAATERESVALTPPLAHQQRDGGDGIPCTTTSSQPTPAPTAPHSGNPLLAIYTALIEVCLNPLEPIALGIIPPKHTAAKPSGEKSDAENGVSADGGLDFRFKPRMDLALKVMSQFGEHVDAPRVLRMIPDDVNLKSLSAFLESAVKLQQSLQTRLVFFMGVARSESVRLRRDCVTATASQMSKVTPMTRCRQCRGRIGTSAFARYPDSGELAHYACCRDLPPTAAADSATTSAPK